MKVTKIAKNVLTLKALYEVKDACKSIPGARWNRKTKVWEYPVTAIVDIVDTFPDVAISTELKKEYLKMKEAFIQVEALKNGKLEPREHPFLMYHQRVCRDIASYMPRYGFFLDTGTGKTLTALSTINDNPAMKWVVVCPKAIIRTAWLEDSAEFFPHLKLLPLSTDMKKGDYIEIAKEWKVRINVRDSKEQIIETLAPHVNAFIVNPESFKRVLPILENNWVTGLIFDESVKLKDNTSQITKLITQYTDNMDKVYLLSGKPAPNTPLEYFSQARILNPAVFGTSFYNFRANYFRPSGYMGYDWKLDPVKESLFASKLGLCSYFVSKDDCLDLPPKTYIIREIDLPSPVMKYYNQMLHDCILELADDRVVAANKLASYMKLRQITSGFVLGEDKTNILHRVKLNHLMDTLEDIGWEKQVIIWCNFKSEIRMIQEELERHGHTVVTAYSGTSDVNDSIKKFKNG
ncbi:MAG: DEAD/DEAH box helicase, partial [Bacilli bacterium]